MKPQLTLFRSLCCLPLLAFLLAGLETSQAQVTYEPGYLLDNSGNRTECLVANEGWGENPRQFQYRIGANGPVQIGTIDDVSEFGIGEALRYERYNVRLDASSDLNADLGYQRNPEFTNQTVFLKVLVDGPARLLAYETAVNKRFFFQTDGNTEITPLIYKRYRTDQGKFGANLQFQNQLASELNCGDNPERESRQTDYKASALIRYFEGYAECRGLPYTSYEKAQGSGFVLVSARLGMSYGTASLEQINPNAPAPGNQISEDFGGKAYPRIGFQVEVFLPSRANRWSLFADPSYQKVAFEKRFIRSYPSIDVEVQANLDYSTIELPVGLRHYVYLGEQHALFFNVSAAMVVNLDSKITFQANQQLGRPDDLDISRSEAYVSFGMGYSFNRKFTFEARVNTGRDLLGNDPDWKAPLNQSGSLILGYAF